MSEPPPPEPHSRAGIGLRRPVAPARRLLAEALLRGAAFGLLGWALLAAFDWVAPFGGLMFGAFAVALAYLEWFAARRAPLTPTQVVLLAAAGSAIAYLGLAASWIQAGYMHMLMAGNRHDDALTLALRGLREVPGWAFLYLSLNLGLATALRVGLGRSAGLAALVEYGRGAAVALLGLCLPLWAPLGVALLVNGSIEGTVERVLALRKPE